MSPLRASLISLLLVACGAPAAPGSVTSDDPDARVMFSVEEAGLPDVVRMLSEITGRPVVLGSRVSPVAGCVSMTISSPEPITAAHAVRLVAYALSDSGLLLEDRPDSIVIRAGESATLPSCDRESHAVQNDRPATTPDVIPPPHEPPLEGIRRVSDTRFVLTRAAMNELLDFRGARLMPHEANGQVEGIRIYGIRRASALGRLGLQNGDLLRQINGHVLASVANALETHAEIRSSDQVTVSLTRRGSEMDIEYVIVDALPE